MTPDHRQRVAMDMHVHSKASSGPAVAALGFIGCPESYSEPERVYELAIEGVDRRDLCVGQLETEHV